MGAGFATPWGEGLFGLTRRRGQRPFEPCDLERFTPYARMANRVVRLRGELAAARRSNTLSRTSLDALALAMITVNDRAQILSQYEPAETVLGRGDGLVASGRIRIGACTQADTNDLRVPIVGEPPRPTFSWTEAPCGSPAAAKRRPIS